METYTDVLDADHLDSVSDLERVPRSDVDLDPTPQGRAAPDGPATDDPIERLLSADTETDD